MFSAFERMVAMRYLRARRKEGFVSVIAGFSLLGICLGVATLIIVMAVMNGFREELLSRILGLNGHLGVYGAAGQSIAEYDPLAAEIAAIDGVVQVIPTVQGQAMATHAGTATGAVVRGMRGEDMALRDVLAEGLSPGGLERFAVGEGILIGHRLAGQLGVQPGDRLTLIAPEGNITAFGTVPRMRAFPVAGIFDVGMYEYDSGFIFMPLAEAQVFFKSPGAVSHLEVILDSVADTEPVGRAVRAAFPSMRVYDWQRSNEAFFNAVQVERNVMFLILTLIILVAAFNIVSGLIMLVQDKGRDIAILRTMGATQGMVQRIFFMSGATIGVLGTLLGLALGLAFATNIETIRQWLQGLTGAELFSAEIYFLSRLPAVVDPVEVVSVCAMSLVLSFAATLYPSWRAARLDPVEALRYE